MAADLVDSRFGIVSALELLAPSPLEPAVPWVVQARLGNHRYLPKEEQSKLSASGKGATPERARLSALGEAVERYSSLFYWPEELLFCRRSELPGPSLDPRELVLYRPEQYADVRYSPYSEESSLGWISGRSLTTGGDLYLPAVATLMAYTPEAQELILGVTSNGVAAAGSLAEAIRSAALELIERDAFVIGWQNRWAVERFDLATHPDPETRRLVEIHRRRGIRLAAFQLPTDLEVAVFLAFGITEGDELPAAVAGLGADTDPARAAAKAVLEVGQIRPALRRKVTQEEHRRRMEELAADPRLVRELEDHDLLYAHPRALSRLSFLLDRPVGRRDWPGASPAHESLTWLVEHLREKGHQLIYFDLTTPDLARLGIHTARAFIPGFQPIDFGYHEVRLGGRRLFELPVQLGWRSRAPEPAELNPDPHPIA